MITQELKQNKLKKILKIIIFLTIFLFISLAVFSNQVLTSEQSRTSWISKLPIIKQIKYLAESADKQLKGEERGRINILLLGMGGKQHDGGYLTDTIILASLNIKDKKVALISIPRDLSVMIEGVGWRKINTINALAEIKDKGSGGLAVCQALSDILEVPIDYYIRIDFEGFINIINELGGVEVYIDNTLDDYKYPIMGREDAEPYESRFEHLHIEKGWQQMDGDLALKYARSRHAYGIEGSDFARAHRQQKIIEAVKDKLLSMNFLLNPKKINNVIGELNDHISTNLKVWEIIKLWKMFKDVKKDDIVNKVLDNGPDGLLVDKISEEGAYILTPRSGDFTEIQYLVNNIFSDAPAKLKSTVSEERVTVEVRNGTWINGLASKTALDLEKYGFHITRIGNCSRQNFQKSVIYDLTYGAKIKSLSVLKEKTGANVAFGLPQWLIDDLEKELTVSKNPIQPDFILILGQDADTTESGLENEEK